MVNYLVKNYLICCTSLRCILYSLSNFNFYNHILWQISSTFPSVGVINNEFSPYYWLVGCVQFNWFTYFLELLVSKLHLRLWLTYLKRGVRSLRVKKHMRSLKGENSKMLVPKHMRNSYKSNNLKGIKTVAPKILTWPKYVRTSLRNIKISLVNI